MSEFLILPEALKLIGLTTRAIYDWAPDRRPPFKMRKLPGGHKPVRTITLAELRAWTREQEKMPEGGRALTAKASGRQIWPE